MSIYGYTPASMQEVELKKIQKENKKLKEQLYQLLILNADKDLILPEGLTIIHNQ